jgi:hypothetical protein
MIVDASRERLSLDLRSYGEDALADRALSIDEETRKRIGVRASDYIPPSGLLGYALTRAAIEILEGVSREPKCKRRKLKGIWPGV